MHTAQNKQNEKDYGMMEKEDNNCEKGQSELLYVVPYVRCADFVRDCVTC